MFAVGRIAIYRTKQTYDVNNQLAFKKLHNNRSVRSYLHESTLSFSAAFAGTYKGSHEDLIRPLKAL